jgi:hypothetical protein
VGRSPGYGWKLLFGGTSKALPPVLLVRQLPNYRNTLRVLWTRRSGVFSFAKFPPTATPGQMVPVFDRADVGRSTFYLHFQDKDELLASGLQNVSQLVRSA